MWANYWTQWAVQNIVPSVLWATPAFVIQHHLLKKHITHTMGGHRG